MRTIVLLDNVAADQAHTSQVVNFEQRGEWMLQVSKSGTDGNPKLIIEYSVDNDANVWTPIENIYLVDFFFLLDDDIIAITDDRLQGKYFRIRTEANGVTTGTIKADLGYKTYP